MKSLRLIILILMFLQNLMEVVRFYNYVIFLGAIIAHVRGVTFPQLQA